VLTKRTVDIRNSVPSSLFTQKSGAHKKRTPDIRGRKMDHRKRVVKKQTLDVSNSCLLFRVFFPRKINVPFLCYHRKRVLTKKTLHIRNSVPSSCALDVWNLYYHWKRVLTKSTPDIRNSVPSSLFTQKTGAHKKGHSISAISNVFVLLVNSLLVVW
jgi:hypothetical protein